MSEIHYTPQHIWDGLKVVILCGAVLYEAVTHCKEAVTCPVCLELLKQERQEQTIKELLGGAKSV